LRRFDREGVTPGRGLRDLSDTHFPGATKIVLVLAAEARRLVERFELHYTPKHGSWLDMADTELSVLSTQCLDRRILDVQTLIEEVAAWEGSRNQKNAKTDPVYVLSSASPIRYIM